MSERLRRLRSEFDTLGINALLVVDLLNVRYLSGFTGSHGALLITRDAEYFVTDRRYVEQASQECPGLEIEPVESTWISGVQRVAQRAARMRMGFESHALTYADWRDLDSSLPGTDLVAIGDPVGRLRMTKDAAEIAAIREAVKIADSAFKEVVRSLEPGLSERDVALEIDSFMRRSGADKEGFDTIVASGVRSAMPHAKPTERRICTGELVMLDFGAAYQGYHSDITRTVVPGGADARQQEIYGIVLEAQSRAIEAVRPGIPGRDVDSVARKHIEEAGYGDCFGHGLGHQLGLSVHDGKALSRQSDVTLEAGMVLTVEPGIYIPGWGGIRIEDVVLVTESGHEVLTQSPKILSLG